jgi:hypothetical protein
MELMVVGGTWVLDLVEWHRTVLELAWLSEEKDRTLFRVKLLGLRARKPSGVTNGCFVMYCISVSAFLAGAVVSSKRTARRVHFKFALASPISI